MFTEIPIEDIIDIKNNFNGSKINEAKVLLANETTRMLHGEEIVYSISNRKRFFTSSKENENIISDSQSVNVDDSEMMASHRVSLKSPTDTCSMAEIVCNAKLSKSKNEARQFIKAGAVRINDVKYPNEYGLVDANSFGKSFIISVGKKKFARIELKLNSNSDAI